MSESINIGDGVSIQFVRDEGEIAGVKWWHPTPVGAPCSGGWVAFAGRAKWVKA